jgi:hypothetical protein
MIWQDPETGKILLLELSPAGKQRLTELRAFRLARTLTSQEIKEITALEKIGHAEN